jgi:hypothetical protein
VPGNRASDAVRTTIDAFGAEVCERNSLMANCGLLAVSREWRKQSLSYKDLSPSSQSGPKP